MDYLWIALGSALGGMARHGVAVAAADRFGSTLPWGTLVVNVVGSFSIGFLASLAAAGRGPFDAIATQRFLMVGLLGGFTTFSSFSLQTLQLFEQGQRGSAMGNVVVSVALCLVGVWLGTRIGRVLAG